MKSFSRKQMELLSWWLPERGTSRYDGIICDGAVRSGKTLCMAISFFAWSMSCFNGQSFALCGKTISSVRRNLLSVVRGTLEEMGFAYSEKVSKNYVELRCGRVCNRYYLFSGKDAASASLIQGMTLAGVLFDEVALQNREFVEQAVARCSVEGSRFWFNCNPEGPGHWFYREWLQRRKQKKLYYLHFVMEDNPALSKRVRKRYELLYSGSFYRRFIQGEWVDVQGLVYPMFSLERHIVQQAPDCERFCVSCDYGTVNPCSMGLWGEQGGRWYRLAEYYYDARREGACRTDEEHYEQLEKLCGNRKIERVIVDPSAASFIACIRRHGRYWVEPAKNGVLEGIQLLEGLPFVSSVLLNIYQAIGQNFERMGNLRFAVTYKPQGGVDGAYAREIAQQMASQWADTMRESGQVKDFVAVGDVDIKVIGADNQALDTQVPVRQMLEQIVAKLGLPPFILGLSWSTTERMSQQQSEILASELESYRALLTPVILRICRYHLEQMGLGGKVQVKWKHISIADEVEQARAKLLDMQAKEIEAKINQRDRQQEGEQDEV